MKSAIKRIVVAAARSAGVLALARLLTRNGVRIVGYHYVSLDDEHERFPALFLTPEQFRRRLEWITARYRVIGLDTAVRQIVAGDIEPNQVVLTFDDGLYNFLGAAVPILEEFSATATVYVISSYMQSQEPIATTLLRDIVLRSKRRNIGDGIDGYAGPTTLDSAAAREALTRWVLDRMLELPHEGGGRTELARSLGHSLDVDVDDIITRRLWHSLSEDEVRTLADRGYDMQVHGHRHLDVVTHPDTVREEIDTCRAALASVTGRDTRDFCYPGGLWSRETWPDVESCGIRSATTTMNGPNFSRTPLLALRRTMDGGDRSDLDFELEVSYMKWLCALPLSPSRIYSPSEKLLPFKVQRRSH